MRGRLDCSTTRPDQLLLTDPGRNEARVIQGRSYLIQFGVQGTAELHVLHQVGALTLIRGDDANLVGFGSRFQQPGGDLLHIGSFSPEKKKKKINEKY